MPRVTIGLPVYNGERFLEETLASLLGQTFRDLDLVISDNGSTDRTPEICRAAVARDSRVRYHREEVNRGAAWNYNRVAALATGEYFKWAAHDDLITPDYIARCVEILDRDPGLVLCHADDQDIDDTGAHVDRRRFSHIPSSERASSPFPHDRFRKLIRLDHDCEYVFGLIRLSVLRRTALIQSYTDSDRTLLGELALYGRFHEIPERLFLHRHHGGSSGRAFPIAGGWHERTAWFDPAKAGKMHFPQWRQVAEYFKAIFRARLGPAETARCLFWFCALFGRHRARHLLTELVAGVGLAVRKTFMGSARVPH
jgi:glycosyltransferase involved in cell wall biosynthesis